MSVDGFRALVADRCHEEEVRPSKDFDDDTPIVYVKITSTDLMDDICGPGKVC